VEAILKTIVIATYVYAQFLKNPPSKILNPYAYIIQINSQIS